MIDAQTAAKTILALPREKRLSTLDRLLAVTPAPFETTPGAVLELARNADVVTRLRVACQHRGIAPPWLDPLAERRRA